MRVEHINPFVASLRNVCLTALDCTIQRGNLKLVDTKRKLQCITTHRGILTQSNRTAGVGLPVKAMRHDVTAFIRMAGHARGTVALRFPAKTAIMAAQAMLDTQDIRTVDETVVDAIAEMVNMVAGGAKKQFTDEMDEPIELSMPTVVRGEAYEADYPAGDKWLEVPFSSEIGPFSMQVSFELSP